ncbi:3-oxo-tetronate kinase [Roseobacter sinensis]|uniref:3-oxo-tetronate kinase n=1 Tax=Roseobacter sinensis TaxID=2931391 RepID=A0ABT3BGP2_9RHOB|nr:3-oxo-tetronate kinase [Roseobacter sp. WL0113]MCV3272755.1 four-carbon acid sugar kinase family protein [Roseobacter sp. WL0113]
MLIGVIADDFTGASDIANTLARGVAPDGGLRTAQFAGIPTDPAPSEIEAGVISLKSRTAPRAAAVDESRTALRWLRAQGCRQIVFKYCSTFDSTPEGNIGPVAEALADELGATKVVFCPAFPATGRTVYQGHLFVHDTPLDRSGMADHPLTPMTDPDIRRWLQSQTRAAVGHLPIDIVRRGPSAIRCALDAADARFLIADAISEDNLMDLGAALADAPLITGGSGIAQGLPRHFIPRATGRAAAAYAGVTGPEAILAGSCSGATRAQVEAHAAAHPTLPIDVRGVMAGTVTVKSLTGFFDANVGRAPLAYSSATPAEVRALQAEFGRDALAARLDTLFAQTASALVRSGYRRLVVAGGETSGAVAQSVAATLKAPAMTIGPEIDPGIPVLTVGDDAPVALALKSGNFGGIDVFQKALRVMESGHQEPAARAARLAQARIR